MGKEYSRRETITMLRIHIICEGQTEEKFIRDVLSPSMSVKQIYLYPSLIGKVGHKCGNFKFERLLTDVRAQLLDDKTAYCTTFFDFYGLPEDFPGKADAKVLKSTSEKANCLLRAMQTSLQEKLGTEPLRRFIPYVQMHEFEGLLFSDIEGFVRGIKQTRLLGEFLRIKESFNSPEDINNSPETAPSKRIVNLYPSYKKTIHGTLAAKAIGLNAIRNECPLFDAWLKKLEKLNETL